MLVALRSDTVASEAVEFIAGRLMALAAIRLKRRLCMALVLDPRWDLLAKLRFDGYRERDDAAG